MNIIAYNLSELLYYQFVSLHFVQINAYNQFRSRAAFHQYIFLCELFPRIIGIT